MAQVFISYSRKDLAFVERLAADLKNAGYDVWYDVSSLRGGSRWRFEIENALRKSQFVIFVLSPDSILSEWVEREFLFSSNLKLGLIPLMYRQCELPLSYLNLNYIDVQGSNYDRNFREILSALGSEPTSLPSPKDLKGATSEPHPQKTVKLSPLILVAAALILGLAVCGGLGAAWYYSNLPPKATTTVPSKETETTPSFIATSRVDSTFTPTSTPVLPSDTPVPPAPVDYWISYDVMSNGSRNIFLLNPATGQQKGIIADPSHDKVGSWSPDGKLLAFESNRGNSGYYQIYLFDSELGSTIKLTNFSDCSNFAPTWSPDGNKIVFYSNCENDQRDIFIMNKNGSGRKNISSSNGEDKFPAFSPNGKLITFTSSRNGKNQIFLMDVNGNNQRFVADGCSSTFSPDGNWLWFSSGTGCEDSNITRLQINGSDLETVGTIPGHNPALSPDGRLVVFQSNFDVWVMDVDGSNPKHLTTGSVSGAPSWRPQ